MSSQQCIDQYIHLRKLPEARESLQRTRPRSPELQVDFLPAEPTGKPREECLLPQARLEKSQDWSRVESAERVLPQKWGIIWPSLSPPPPHLTNVKGKTQKRIKPLLTNLTTPPSKCQIYL